MTETHEAAAEHALFVRGEFERRLVGGEDVLIAVPPALELTARLLPPPLSRRLDPHCGRNVVKL